jgi:acyl-CoA synthetase (NDP forming)
MSARTVAADPHVDTLMIIGCGLTPEDTPTFVQYMIEVQKECRKPLVMVKIHGYDPELGPQFCKAGVPFFDSAERAIQTYALAYRYRQWRRKKRTE